MPSYIFDIDYNSDDGVTIIKYHGSDEVVRIPKTISGKPVTKIERYAFAYKKSLKKVIIPETVTYIAERAFWQCLYLNAIEYPGNLMDILR